MYEIIVACMPAARPPGAGGTGAEIRPKEDAAALRFSKARQQSELNAYPLYETRPVTTVKDLFKYPLEHTPDKDAFRVRKDKDSFEGISWKQFKEDVDALGTALYARGFKGSHLCVMGDNLYEWILVYMTALCGDMVIVPLDKDLPAVQIEKLIEFADGRALFYTPRYEKIAEAVREYVPDVSLFCNLRGDGPSSLGALLEEGRKLLASGDTSFTSEEPDTKKMAALLFTSGTAGKQKGVMLSQENIVASFDGACKNVSFDENDVMLSVLPLHHAYETNCGILAMLHTSTVVCFNENLKLLMPNLQLFKPTGMSVVPLILDTLYRQFRDAGRRSGLTEEVLASMPPEQAQAAMAKLQAGAQQAVGGRLHKGFVGGAPMNPEILGSLRKLGMNFPQGYGITECSPLVSVNRNDQYKDASVGLPTPANEVRIQDGEIQVKGKNVMLGYYKDPEETEAAFTEDGWFRTGDLGYIDDEGFLFITGRKKNLIILESGENISPEELEANFTGRDLINEIVVMEDDGQITAHIHPDYDYAAAAGIEDVPGELNRIVAEVNSTQPRYKHIANVKVHDQEFEKTTTKKILRHKVGKD